MNAFTLQIPASTSNLGPGFDTLGLALNLYLNISVAIAENGQNKVVVHGEGADTLPADDSNVVLRAYRKACRYFHSEAPPIKVELDNEIPVERGLGSSGAAVAAGLAIACRALGKSAASSDVLQLGAELEGHPENVSASLLGGLTINAMHAGRCFSHRISPAGRFKVVALIPDFTIATHAARALLPEKIAFAQAVSNVQNTALLVAALAAGDFELLSGACVDHLHQPFREKLIPGFADVVQAARQAGAAAAFLSGSGSTIIALAPQNAEKVARAMTAAANRQGFGFRCRILEPDLAGVCGR